MPEIELPRVEYARSGDVAIAYQVVGAGDVDLVLVRGTIADLLASWTTRSSSQWRLYAVVDA